MSVDVLGGISRKLDQILGLMAIRDLSDDGEKVLRLKGLGLDHAAIAAVTGLTVNAVGLRISRSGKPSKSPKTRKAR